MKNKRGKIPTLFDGVVNEKVFADLESSRAEIEEFMENLNRNFGQLKETILESRMIVAIYNGRVDPLSIELAHKVIGKAEKNLFNMMDDIRLLKKNLDKIDSIKTKFEQCRNSEERALSVEKYLSSDSSDGFETINVKHNLHELDMESRQLQHSIKALLELKAGK